MHMKLKKMVQVAPQSQDGTLDHKNNLYGYNPTIVAFRKAILVFCNFKFALNCNFEICGLITLISWLCFFN